MKTTRSATGSTATALDNTTEFINIVKKYDVLYNVHNPDYKNVEVKMMLWSQIAEEIGLSKEASKRKWKNLRDSYTKYLRSFRVGTKAAKKYQYWAHAEHMDFLKPFQGAGRISGNIKTNEDDGNECEFTTQVLTTTSSEEDLQLLTAAKKHEAATTSESTTLSPPSKSKCCKNAGATMTPAAAPIVLPVPSLPTVQLPPQLTNKSIVANSLTSQTSLSQTNSNSNGLMSTPSSNTASSVGCLIIEPQLINTKDTMSSCHTNRINAPLFTKLRRVPTACAPKTALNLSFGTVQTATYSPSSKMQKLCEKVDLNVATILQANRDLDANTLFFLSLARTVRAMPTKFQSLAKMRCMRIVSDLELELDNSQQQADENTNHNKCNIHSHSSSSLATQNVTNHDAGTEHFVYVMSPSRVEGMVDISSDEELTTTTNGS